MEKHAMHTETRYDDLSGTMSINFRENENFATFAARVAGVDPNLYEPVAMRLYLDKEAILTIYATERGHAPAKGDTTSKMKVKKFKVGISAEDLFGSLRQLDFTLLRDGLVIDNLEVIDK